MILPEFPLSSGSEGSNSSLLGEGMLSQGVVFEDQLHLQGEFLEQLLEVRREPPTSRSLKTTEHPYHHWGVSRPS